MNAANDPVRYMARTRDYYAAQGYDAPYAWSHHDDIPFAPLTKPLSECTATIVCTAMPDATYDRAHRRLHVGDFDTAPDAFYTGELAWDRDATHTNDRESYFPLNALRERIDAGDVGGLAPHFYCIPTLYSQRRTIERDAPAIVASCLDNEVDVALLVPL